MAATTFLLSNGTVLSVSTDGGTTWIPIKQMKSISFSGSAANFEDITNLDSPGAYKEVAPTTLDPGKVTLSGVFKPTDPGQIAISAAFESQALLEYKLQFLAQAGQQSGFKRTWNAYTAEKPAYNPEQGKTVPFSGSLQISGPMTDTPGA